MLIFRPCSRWPLALLAALSTVAPARADGFLLAKFGKYIPEREQRAFIEWQDGRETLCGATRSDPAAGPAVWIVPVPSRPQAVKAEPVELFRHVAFTRSATEESGRVLSDTVLLT